MGTRREHSRRRLAAEAAGFGWQGYLLEPLGLGPKLDGPWTYANLGVMVALVLPFLAYLLLGCSEIRRQEALEPSTQTEG